MTAHTPNTIGPAGLAVAAKIRMLRRRRGLSLRAFALATVEHGRAVSVDGLNKLEVGARRIDIDDLFVIAAALGITPAQLLEPDGVCSVCHSAPKPMTACLACGAEGAT
jgi:transcriptional regulator with XRE-family HTH domain